MRLSNPLFGAIETTEPVIVDLIESKAMQRLKGIDQSGYAKPFFDVTYNRFDHSVGVYWLLHLYKASLEEQIAGLIHDVSHSAFSHTIDYIFDEGSHEQHTYQDDIFSEFVKKTEIPSILKKHGLDVDYVLDDSNFTLEEKELPDLCADRIDYALRGAIHYGQINKAGVDQVLSKLKENGKDWYFVDQESATAFAQLFNTMNSKYYADFKSGLMFQTISDCMRYSLKKGYITKEDLYQTDDFVISKLRLHKDDAQLNIHLDRMFNKIKAVNDSKNYDVKVVCKSRIVDPLFMRDKKLVRLSDADSNWAKLVAKELKPKEYFIRFER